MDDQNKNLILAMVLSTLVLVIWMVLFAPAPPEPGAETTAGTETSQATDVPSPDTSSGPDTGSVEETVAATPQAPRVPISTPSLEGSISLAGGRIDQLGLVNYRVSIEPGAEDVKLLSPVGTARPYYAVFGWVPGGDLATGDVPATDTMWSVESGETLTPETPLVLIWESPSGLVFRRTIEVVTEIVTESIGGRFENRE